MQNVIEQFRKLIIQIATPYSTGTGFLLPDEGIIVTNYHVVEGISEMVIEGELVPRQLTKLVFVDLKHDLALLAAPRCPSVQAVVLSPEQPVQPGNEVVAIGHPFGLKFSVTHGIVSGIEPLDNGISYIQHDAALNPGNSGGPLVNRKGEVIGVNTFIVTEGESLGFSLPAHFVLQALAAWKKGNGAAGICCGNCGTTIFEGTIQDRYCPNCGTEIVLPSDEGPYNPTGIARTVEAILTKCGHDVCLARRGPNAWEIEKGSATIFITYYEPNGLIAGDAILCELPAQNISPVYEFLLRQNYDLEALSLSVRGNEVVLSLVVYDRYLNIDSGMKLFKNLFEKADYFDNVLVEQFGAKWKERNDL